MGSWRRYGEKACPQDSLLAACSPPSSWRRRTAPTPPSLTADLALAPSSACRAPSTRTAQPPPAARRHAGRAQGGTPRAVGRRRHRRSWTFVALYLVRDQRRLGPKLRRAGLSGHLPGERSTRTATTTCRCGSIVERLRPRERRRRRTRYARRRHHDPRRPRLPRSATTASNGCTRSRRRSASSVTVASGPAASSTALDRWLSALYGDLARTLAAYLLASSRSCSGAAAEASSKQTDHQPYDAADCEKRCRGGDARAARARRRPLPRRRGARPRDPRVLDADRSDKRGDASVGGALGDLLLSDDGALRDALARRDAHEERACDAVATATAARRSRARARTTGDVTAVAACSHPTRSTSAAARRQLSLTHCTGWGAYDCFTLATISPATSRHRACSRASPAGGRPRQLRRARLPLPARRRLFALALRRACGAGFCRACGRFGGTITATGTRSRRAADTASCVIGERSRAPAFPRASIPRHAERMRSISRLRAVAVAALLLGDGRRRRHAQRP